MAITRFLLSLAVVLTLASRSHAADWPQFQGPTRDNVAPAGERILPAWPSEGPEVLWTVPVGEGFGGAAVHGNEVFLLDRPDESGDKLRVLDLHSGKEIWAFSYPAPGKLSFPGSRSVPTVDADSVYIVGGYGQVHCIDRKTRQPRWSMNLMTDYKTKLPNWGVTQSVLLYKDMAILAPQAASVGLAAFDKTTGAKRWESPAIGKPGYVSPALLTIAGVEQVVMVTPTGVHAVAPDTGKLLWSTDAYKCKLPIPAPTLLGPDTLLVTGGYDAGSTILRITRDGDAFTPALAARIAEHGSQIHPAIVSHGRIYLKANTNSVNGGLLCLDPQLKVLWQHTDNSSKDDKGVLLLVDGKLLDLNGATGQLTLIDPSDPAYKPLASCTPVSGKQMWAPIAFAGGLTIVRDQTQLKCLDLRVK